MQMIRMILPVLACALLLHAASAQDIDLITPEGQKQMLAEPGTDQPARAAISAISVRASLGPVAPKSR